jgi:YHS domain-containing protein
MPFNTHRGAQYFFCLSAVTASFLQLPEKQGFFRSSAMPAVSGMDFA